VAGRLDDMVLHMLVKTRRSVPEAYPWPRNIRELGGGPHRSFSRGKEMGRVRGGSMVSIALGIARRVCSKEGRNLGVGRLKQETGGAH